MKKFYSLVLLLIISFSCVLFVGCNQHTEKTEVDSNEFVIERINQDDRYVLFAFTYTQEMFDYEIQRANLQPGAGDLVIRCRINNADELTMCGNVNPMYGIKYEGFSSNECVLAHKPNEKVYFYMEFDPGDYNITFYLEYAANSPYILLREYTLSFNVL